MKTPSIEVGIVADDLTSAADGAGPFVAAGRSAVVGRAGHVPAAGAVRAVDAGTRVMRAAGAAAACGRAIAALAAAAVLFKTVDSTLRGHIAEEMSAAFAASGRSSLVLAPAFPAAGRTTQGGIQCVAGVPVTATEYARDPVHPVTTAVLAELVQPGLGEPARVDAGDPGSLGLALQRHRVVIVDASTQEALNAAVAGVDGPEAVLWVGSPGLARALAARLSHDKPSPPPAVPSASRILVVVGTLNTRSRAQLVRLAAAGAEMIEMRGPTPQVAGPARRLLCLASPEKIEPDSEALTLALAARAEAIVASHQVDTLVVTGGYTLDVLLAGLGIRQLSLCRELEPGFALARADVTQTALECAPAGLTVATKAGGFGGPLALVRAVECLWGTVALPATAQAPDAAGP